MTAGSGALVPKHKVSCVECGHDISWHYSQISDQNWAIANWTQEEWERWRKAGKDGPCQNEGCACRAFKHPEAPRRREAIEHTRRMG